MNLCMRESRFLCKTYQAELIYVAVDVGDQSWREMAACSHCQSAWVNCQTHKCWNSSLRIVREMTTFTSIWSDEEQKTCAGKLVITTSRREDLLCGEIWVEKFTDRVSPMESQKSIAEVPWLVREVQTAKLHGDNIKCHIWGRESLDERLKVCPCCLRERCRWRSHC